MSKKQKRRTFVKQGLATTAALPLLSTGLWSCKAQSEGSKTNEPEKIKPLNILILGGTGFLGPHQVAYAISRGHKVTIFNRGKSKPSTNKDVFDQVEILVGDRETDLTALHDRSWDVVIDNSGRKVEWTDKTAELLKDKCGLYLYVSSVSVYYPYLTENIVEDTPLVLEMPDELENEDEKYVYDYGIMKANSELTTISHFGKDRSIIVRPTFIIGPGDNTNRFIHWPVRLSQGGDVLVPGKKSDQVQYIDARDLASWMIRLAENKEAGTYNGAGPTEKKTMETFITEAVTAFDIENNLIFIEDYDFLEENEMVYIVPWVLSKDKFLGCSRANNDNAIATGLTCRPIAETTKDTYDWWVSEDVNMKAKEKYEADASDIVDKEKALLEKWKSRG